MNYRLVRDNVVAHNYLLCLNLCLNCLYRIMIYLGLLHYIICCMTYTYTYSINYNRKSLGVREVTLQYILFYLINDGIGVLPHMYWNFTASHIVYATVHVLYCSSMTPWITILTRHAIHVLQFRHSNTVFWILLSACTIEVL